jgi:CII-binding regulator of phage lambda lysogenization HflD
MNSTRTVAVRLDNLVAQEYERLAQLKGDKLGTYLRDLLTSNIQMASIERQVSRVEELVNEFEKDINRSLDKFTQQNRLNEKFYEDFGGVYMMLLSTLMQLKVEKEDIRGMQAKGDAYAQRNYLAGKK